MENLVHFIYVTENKVDGKLYIGQHSCSYDKQFTDGYLGSGRALLRAIKKYGKQNFERIIIEYAESKEELNELESKYVTEEIIEDRNFYNMQTGGKQNLLLSNETRKKMSENHWDCAGKNHPMYGKHHSEDAIKKMSTAGKGRTPWNKGLKGVLTSWNKGGHLTEEQKKHLSEINKGKHHTEETKKKISQLGKGRKMSAESRRKISETLMGHPVSKETRKKISEANMKRIQNKQSSTIVEDLPQA